MNANAQYEITSFLRIAMFFEIICITCIAWNEEGERGCFEDSKNRKVDESIFV
jgi:hypothetical protein